MGNGFRTVLATTLAALVAAFTLVSAPLASATTTPHCVPVDTNAVSKVVSSLTRSGASHSTISTALKKEFGVTEVAVPAPRIVRPHDSSSNNVTIGTPSWYYDSCAGGYYITSGWSWSTLSGLNTGSHDEGFALSFNTSVRITGKSLTYWGNRSGVWGLGNANSQDSYGLGWEFSVYYDGSNYPAYAGSIVVYADRGGACAPTWGTSDYSHGWAGNTLNSWTISSTGASANYSNGSWKWQAYGNAGGAHELC